MAAPYLLSLGSLALSVAQRSDLTSWRQRDGKTEQEGCRRWSGPSALLRDKPSGERVGGHQEPGQTIGHACPRTPARRSAPKGRSTPRTVHTVGLRARRRPPNPLGQPVESGDLEGVDLCLDLSGAGGGTPYL